MTLKENLKFKNALIKHNDFEEILLEESILNEGCRSAIIVWNGYIVDGYKRYEICEKYDIPYLINDKLLSDYNNEKEIIDWKIKNQLSQRNLPKPLYLYFVGKLYNDEKDEHGGDRHKKSNGRTCERLAKLLDVSAKTIQRAGKFADALTKIEELLGEDYRNKILGCEIQVTQSLLIDLVKNKDSKIKEAILNIEKGKYHNVLQPKRNKTKSGEEKDLDTNCDNNHFGICPHCGESIIMPDDGIEPMVEPVIEPAIEKVEVAEMAEELDENAAA